MMRTSLSIALGLAFTGTLSACGGGADAPAPIAKGNLEKPVLKLGFIKLTDMAPLAIAREKGFFAEEGLTVTLEPQANWKVLLDGVIGGQLDGAHMLAGQPIAARIGLGVKGDLVAPISLDLNGNAITLSNKVYAMIAPTLLKGSDGKPTHPISAAILKPIAAKLKTEGKPLKMGMVFPVSPHNYELRYWLAAGGINPGFYLPGDVAGTTGAEVQLSVTPPPQMPSTMEAGTIDGYSVGEPWNQAAVAKKIGVPVITDHQIAEYNPEKVLGLTKAFAESNPKTTKALIRAIIKAQMWLDADNGKNRPEAAEILARPNYVGADAKVIAASMTGQFTFAPGDTRPAPDFNIFFRNNAGYPFYSDAIWYLTQMRRWGQIPEAKDDAWYLTTAQAVYRPDLYMAAAKSLVAEGKAPANAFPRDEGGIRPNQGKFIDGVPFDATKPNAYLASLAIGLKGAQKVTPAGVQ
jgi:nitrate/nitrite transport system substrate-binding protein